MPQPQLAFELLVILLAHPTRLDPLRQRAQRSPGFQVEQVVLALSVRAPLANEPHLLARQMTVVTLDRAVAYLNADRRESSCGPAPPGTAAATVTYKTESEFGTPHRL